MMTSISELESKLLSLLKGEYSSLSITYNDHALGDESFGGVAYLPFYDLEFFVSLEDRQKCLDENKLWVVKWYRHSSVNLRHAMGSSLELALSKVFEIGKC